MAELPKIVKSQLSKQQSGPARAHPDADLLTAFIEQNLTTVEREQVLAHLAVCAECREVAALALPPQAEAADANANAPERQTSLASRYPRWGFMRWGAAAAVAALVVAALVFMKPEPDSGLRATASNKTAEPVPAAAPPVAQRPENRAYVDSLENQNSKVMPKADKEERFRQLQPQPGFVTDGSDIANKLEKDKSEETAAAKRRLDETAVSGRAANAVSSDVVSMKNTPITPVESKGLRDETAARPAQSINGNAGVSAGMAGGVLGGLAGSGGKIGSIPGGAAEGTVGSGSIAPKLQPSKSAKALREEATQAAEVRTQPDSLNDAKAGEAQPRDYAKADKETDSVSLTESVEVSARASSSRNVAKKISKDNVPAQSFWYQDAAWRVTRSGKLQKQDGEQWREVKVARGVKVLVAATRPGGELWAGGQPGALYRQTEGVWKPVTGGWTGDVVEMEFTDNTHGSFATSTGERWMTGDGGVSWQKKKE